MWCHVLLGSPDAYHPHWEGYVTPRKGLSHALWIVISNPCCRQNIWIVADEPRIEEIICGTCFTCEVQFERVGLCSSTTRRHLNQQPVCNASHHRIHYLFRFGGRMLFDNRAITVFDGFDEYVRPVYRMLQMSNRHGPTQPLSRMMTPIP